MDARKYLLATAMVGFTLALGSCSHRPSQGVLIPVAEAADGTSRVMVLAVGTRARSTTDPGEMFSGERGDGLSYAMVSVSIPPDAARAFGEVQWPASVPGDPHRDFVTLSADYLDKRSFLSATAKIAKQTGYREALVFVHGYNNRFDDAVYRFAQIVHDTKAPVIPILFTWPSRGEVMAYTYDR
jgi:esterase/lipase superfamily enzyme